MWIAAAYLLMSLVTFIAFAWDKRAARLNRWRTRESTLHVLELLGGFPGAFLAQRLLRHKSYKPRYRAILWAIAALHGVGWAIVIYLSIRG